MRFPCDGGELLGITVARVGEERPSRRAAETSDTCLRSSPGGGGQRSRAGRTPNAEAPSVGRTHGLPVTAPPDPRDRSTATSGRSPVGSGQRRCVQLVAVDANYGESEIRFVGRGDGPSPRLSRADVAVCSANFPRSKRRGTRDERCYSEYISQFQQLHV